jgi:hypothetical protein
MTIIRTIPLLMITLCPKIPIGPLVQGGLLLLPGGGGSRSAYGPAVHSSRRLRCVPLVIITIFILADGFARLATFLIGIVTVETILIARQARLFGIKMEITARNSLVLGKPSSVQGPPCLPCLAAFPVPANPSGFARLVPLSIAHPFTLLPMRQLR